MIYNRRMETQERTPIPIINPIVAKELGTENLGNIMKLNAAIQEEANRSRIETHLLLIGGNVKPEKRGKFHKDVDLKLYSPQLATEVFTGGESPKFDIFASFINKIASTLNWKINVEKPWFHDYEFCSDGKVVLQTTGSPIEILPTREDSIKPSFKEFLDQNADPHAVLH